MSNIVNIVIAFFLRTLKGRNQKLAYLKCDVNLSYVNDHVRNQVKRCQSYRET